MINIDDIIKDNPVIHRNIKPTAEELDMIGKLNEKGYGIVQIKGIMAQYFRDEWTESKVRRIVKGLENG